MVSKLTHFYIWEYCIHLYVGLGDMTINEYFLMTEEILTNLS